MRDCGIRRVAERQGLLLCWWMECREMIRMESLAGFQAHASLPDLEDSFTVLIRISRLVLCLAFVCVSSPLCAVPSMSAAIDDKLCEAWIVDCRGGYSVSFSKPEHAAWVEVFQRYVRHG